MPKRQVIIPVGPSIAYVPLTRELYALIDSEDAEKVGQRTWHVVRSHKTKRETWYARTNKSSIYGPSVSLHRYVFHTRSECVDHRNGNPLDCRKVNLRSATNTQNRYNSLPKSAYPGVDQITSGRFRARITIDRKLRELGYFDTPAEAYEAYRRAATIVHGDFIHSSLTGPN